MDRNISLKIKNRKDGQRVFAPSMVSTVEVTSTDPVIIASETTRLDLLAHTYLGNRSLWWMIAQVNGITNGSLHVTPGRELVIPVSAARR